MSVHTPVSTPDAAVDHLHIQSLEILKYPRTPHIEGSRLQAGDEGQDHVLLATLANQYAVVEEKLDGANAAISFTAKRTTIFLHSLNNIGFTNFCTHDRYAKPFCNIINKHR